VTVRTRAEELREVRTDMQSGLRRLVSIPEARTILGGIGHTTVYQLVNRGEIVKVNIGRRGFITSESLEAYMDRLNPPSASRDPIPGSCGTEEAMPS